MGTKLSINLGSILFIRFSLDQSEWKSSKLIDLLLLTNQMACRLGMLITCWKLEKKAFPSCKF